MTLQEGEQRALAAQGGAAWRTAREAASQNWWLLGIIALGILIRLYRLNFFSYWLDEILEVRFIQNPWAAFWKTVTFDGVHPPLDYLVVRSLEKAGPADWERKLPAVLWGAGTIAAVGGLFSRRAGPRVGLLAALLLACAPFHVRYSQELRPYSLSFFLLTLSLLFLDMFLDRPSVVRCIALYLGCLATAYTLYLAAFVLVIAAMAMLSEDALDHSRRRRRVVARYCLALSPAFAGLLFLGYLPWWPVVVEVSRRPAATAAIPITWQRAGRVLSFFAFAPRDGRPLGLAGAGFVLLVVSGAWVALRRQGLRFLLAWAVLGLVAVEVLSQLHPHYDADRRYSPAGLALPVLAGVALGAAWASSPRSRWICCCVLVGIVFLDGRALVTYFREGRPDWRRLASAVRQHVRAHEKLFAENQWTQLCLGFYLMPHDRGAAVPFDVPAVLNLDGEVIRLTWSWEPGARAWLVLSGAPEYEHLRRWAEVFPVLAVVPQAEGGAVLKRLDPELRTISFARVPP